jgi:uncharacterized protein YgiM (DUF1202 family)
MSRRFVLTLTLVFSVLLMGLVPTALAAPSTQATDTAQLRLVHAIPEAPAVDVLVDGALAASQLAYSEYTTFVQLAAGDHAVSVQAGEQVIVEAAVSVTAGQALTAIVMGTADAPEVQVFEDDLSPLVVGNIRLNAIHAVSGADAVDVILPDGSPVLQGLAYGNASGGIDIPANVYPLGVVATGGTVDNAIISPTEFYLGAGMLYRIVVMGSAPDVLVLETPVMAAEDSVLVRVAHAIDGAPAVDVYANDTLLIPNLEARDMSAHIALPLDSYELSVRTAGEDNVAAIASVSLDLSDSALAGQARTVAAVDKGDTLGLQVYEDDASVLAPANARINILNALSGSVLTAALDDGTDVPVTAPFEGQPFTVEVPAGAYRLLIADASGSSVEVAMPFNGGALYSLLVAGVPEEPAVIMGVNALSVQPGSVVSAAPAAAPETTAPEATEPEATEEPAAQPTAEPTQAPPPPTAVPAQSAAPTEGFIGLIYNLNPGASLQLREYPRADARSLGLATGGAVVTVLGRAGEPDFQNLADLPDGEDLEPTETWLSVEYVTPEGSTIRAWTIAQYVQVTEDGDRVRLADLEPLPSDIPGEATGGAAPAPTQAPVSADFYAIVFNLNPDANLNIRRSPDVLAEVLAQAAPGTVLEPTAILEDSAWTFVTFRPEGGGEITGWVATEFVQFVFRGQNYLPNEERITELLQRSLLDIGDPTVRGAVSGDVQTGQATEAPSTAEFYGIVFNLNPDANLNIRRQPDTLAEVLAAVSPGTVLEPVGLLEDFSWTFVTFRPEGGGEITGWVATEFVQFVFRGQNYLPNEERINELLQRSLMTFVAADERGAISEGAGDASAEPTSDTAQFRNQYLGTTLLDPGSNLHLRLTPDAASESLALIPSGANMLVIGRTSDANWLEVEYDSTSGWVASAYVEIRLNGRRVDLEDIPEVAL